MKSRVLALTSLYLLVVCAIGMLHPARNALVLGALGGRNFYKVYLASALVVVAVVPFGRLAERVPQRILTPAVACFFAVNLVLFRAFFPGGLTLGILFYAWHDLYSGILVSQFFMATKDLLDPRSAKTTYPLIVGAGSIGSAVGGAVTAYLTPTIGLANLLLVAAALTVLFAIGLVVLSPATTSAQAANTVVHADHDRASPRAVIANRQVQLIAATVLLTVLVKQLVDYQFNAASAAVGDREAITAFQGKFNAATQWLPLVAAAAIRPALTRWGVGAALLMLPAGMILANALLAFRGGLTPAAVAKGTETALRYSAERTGREILYFPVPAAVRARAKPLIDVALESGLAKAAGAGLIFVLLALLGTNALPWAAVILAVVWLGCAVAERRAYVQALATMLRAPAPGLRELGATLADPDTDHIVRATLGGDDIGRIVLVLDVLATADRERVETFAPELRALARFSDPAVRHRLAKLASPSPSARVDRPIATPVGTNGSDAVSTLLHTAEDTTLGVATRVGALRALRRLHDRADTIAVDGSGLHRVIDEHLHAAERYASAAASLHGAADHWRVRLLRQATVEAWQTRQAAVFDAIAVNHDPRVVEGCYRAITGTDDRRRAEALELVSEATTQANARRLAPILRQTPDDEPSHRDLATSESVIASLRHDEDAWVARCAAACDTTTNEDDRMNPIERVFLLQGVDAFEHASSHHLARIALLASEVEADAGAALLSHREPAHEMYVVIEGELIAEDEAGRSRSIGPGEAVGALAILDEAPSEIDVRVARASRLLRLSRRALHDALRDDPDLAVSLLAGMAGRLRWVTATQLPHPAESLATHD